jgi:hypothetical protein
MLIISRLITTFVAVLAILASPSGALAHGTSSGTVLSLDANHHTPQVIDAGHLVHAYTYTHRLGKLGPGSRISFRLAGSRIGRVRVAGRSASLTFRGVVVTSTAKALVLRLADGQTLALTGRQLPHARVVRDYRSTLVTEDTALLSSSGSGTAQASTGAPLAFTVAVSSDSSASLFPGGGSETLNYTVRNPSTTSQQLTGTSAAVVTGPSGGIIDAGIEIVGCQASWFSAVNNTPAGLPQDTSRGMSSTP